MFPAERGVPSSVMAMAAISLVSVLFLPETHRRDLRDLLDEPKRTNRLLQGLIYGGLGFALGLVVMQIVVRVRLF